MHRSNVLVASSDVLPADLVGASILGHAPEKVPHLVYAAQNRGRSTDMADIDVRGEKIEGFARFNCEIRENA
jgi:uncharacterized protein (DUF362 family)